MRTYMRYRSGTTVLLCSVSLCLLRACTPASCERIERQRGVESGRVSGYEELCTRIDATKRGEMVENVRREV